MEEEEEEGGGVGKLIPKRKFLNKENVQLKRKKKARYTKKKVGILKRKE